VPKRADLPLVTIKHSTVLKPNIRHYASSNSKATSSLGYILRQNAKIKEKYTIVIFWYLKNHTLHWTKEMETRKKKTGLYIILHKDQHLL